MGLERVAAVMQGVHDNYDTDTFKALIAESGALTHTATTGANQASHRVIADHLRCSGFLVADGVLPANEGRGYVLRRIMRRAMRQDRKSVVWGKSVSVRVDLGGRRIMKKTTLDSQGYMNDMQETVRILT